MGCPLNEVTRHFAKFYPQIIWGRRMYQERAQGCLRRLLPQRPDGRLDCISRVGWVYTLCLLTRFASGVAEAEPDSGRLFSWLSYRRLRKKLDCRSSPPSRCFSSDYVNFSRRVAVAKWSSYVRLRTFSKGWENAFRATTVRRTRRFGRDS